MLNSVSWRSAPQFLNCRATSFDFIDRALAATLLVLAVTKWQEPREGQPQTGICSMKRPENNLEYSLRTRCPHNCS